MPTRRNCLVILLVICSAIPGRLLAQAVDPGLSAWWERGREFFFTVSPEEAEVRPSAEVPNVVGVVMDWHIAVPPPSSATVVLTAIAIADGTSSVYTSKGTAIMGGYAATLAAKEVVRLAERHLSRATLTSSHAPPNPSYVRFYIRTYNDLRVIEAPARDLLSGKSSYSELFIAANRVISELRQAVENQATIESGNK